MNTAIRVLLISLLGLWGVGAAVRVYKIARNAEDPDPDLQRAHRYRDEARRLRQGRPSARALALADRLDDLSERHIVLAHARYSAE